MALAERRYTPTPKRWHVTISFKEHLKRSPETLFIDEIDELGDVVEYGHDWREIDHIRVEYATL